MFSEGSHRLFIDLNSLIGTNQYRKYAPMNLRRLLVQQFCRPNRRSSEGIQYYPRCLHPYLSLVNEPVL